MDYITRLRPGQQPTAEEFNRLVDALESLSQVSGTYFGQVGVARSSDGAIQILDGTNPGHWGVVGTGDGQGNYAHQTAEPNADGTWTTYPVSSDLTYGTTTQLPARDANDSISVAAGARVWLHPDSNRPGYIFQAPAKNGFFARLINQDPTPGPGWNFIRQTLSGTTYVDSGSVTTGYPAIPLTIDGTNYAYTPVAGLRAWVIPDADGVHYDFLPLGPGSGVTGFWARITASGSGVSAGLYAWTEVTSGGTATWSDTSTTSGGVCNASPVPFWDGSLSTASAPSIEVGMRVWMYPGIGGGFEFLPWCAADDTTQGDVSTTYQRFAGGKGFDAIQVNVSGTIYDQTDWAPGYSLIAIAPAALNTSSGSPIVPHDISTSGTIAGKSVYAIKYDGSNPTWYSQLSSNQTKDGVTGPGVVLCQQSGANWNPASGPYAAIILDSSGNLNLCPYNPVGFGPTDVVLVRPGAATTAYSVLKNGTLSRGQDYLGGIYGTFLSGVLVGVPGYRNVVANYGMTVTDGTILASAAAGNITVTLPVSSAVGAAYTIKKVDNSANTVTVVDSTSVPIDGASSYVLSGLWQSATFTLGSTIGGVMEWFITASH